MLAGFPSVGIQARYSPSPPNPGPLLPALPAGPMARAMMVPQVACPGGQCRFVRPPGDTLWLRGGEPLIPGLIYQDLAINQQEANP